MGAVPLPGKQVRRFHGVPRNGVATRSFIGTMVPQRNTKKLEGKKLAIIGTGAYVLDFPAKTPVAQIHLYDKDGLPAQRFPRRRWPNSRRSRQRRPT